MKIYLEPSMELSNSKILPQKCFSNYSLVIKITSLSSLNKFTILFLTFSSVTDSAQKTANFSPNI